MQQFFGLPRLWQVLLASALVALAACSRETPEQAVRKQIDAMHTAIAARDARAIHDFLADDFIGNESMDRHAAKRLATAIFLRHRDVDAKVGPVRVELRADSDAIARFSVLVTGGSGGLLPDSGQVYQVETGWRRVEGEWKLLNARWTPPGE